jgi:hypothetical protein
LTTDHTCFSIAQTDGRTRYDQTLCMPRQFCICNIKYRFVLY